MIPDSSRACVVGVGAATPLGFSAPMSAAAVRANLSRFQESPWVDKTGEPIRLSIADYIDPKLRGVDRLVELAWLSVEEALKPLQDVSSIGALGRIPVLIGCAAARPGF